MHKIFACLVAVLHLTIANNSEQPMYQVSIMCDMPGSVGSPMHICNGVIIVERMILTMADCMHIKFGPNGKPNKLDASVLSVIAGSTNANTTAIRANVSDIEISQQFNPFTLENDLALLKLTKPLPLGTRPDIKWIMLDDNSHVNSSCLVNFFSRNSKDAIPNFYQTEQIQMIKNDVCRNATKYPAARRSDFCSLYILPHKFSCAAAEAYLSFNNDRGTGLVCRSYLVGLLSSVVTRPDPAKNCSDVVLKAVYTNVYPHLRWIYTVMAALDTEYISTPYDASLNPLMSNSNPNFGNSTTNSSIPANSTLSLTNSTNVYPLYVNSTITNTTTVHVVFINSTMTNSTMTNSTITNSTIFINTTSIVMPANTTNWNTTTLHVTNSSTNHTVHRPPITNTVVRPVWPPVYGSTTESHIRYQKPTIHNSFTKNAATGRFTPGSILMVLISLGVTAICL